MGMNSRWAKQKVKYLPDQGKTTFKMLCMVENKSSFVRSKCCSSQLLELLEIKLRSIPLHSSVRSKWGRCECQNSLRRKKNNVLCNSSFQSISSRLIAAAVKYIQVKSFSNWNCWTLQQMSHAWAIINKEMEKEHGKYTTSYQDMRSVGEKTSAVFFYCQ